jgi:predicted nucleic acid-binding protein
LLWIWHRNRKKLGHGGRVSCGDQTPYRNWSMNIKLRWIVESNVLDSFAILSFMQDEEGAGVVETLLRHAQAGQVRLLVSVINLGEVFYRLAKSKGSPVATEFRRALSQKTFPWQAVSATDARVWAAAELKAQFALAYADAFAVALAREAHAPLVTGDPEILALSPTHVQTVAMRR